MDGEGQRMSNLRMGLPSKGRLAEDTAELLTQAGLSFRRQDRVCSLASVNYRLTSRSSGPKTSRCSVPKGQSIWG